MSEAKPIHHAPQFRGLAFCPKCETEEYVEQLHYSKKSDPLIYSHLTDDFTREDWIKLAFAALDQGSADKKIFDYLVSELGVETDWGKK